MYIWDKIQSVKRETQNAADFKNPTSVCRLVYWY